MLVDEGWRWISTIFLIQIPYHFISVFTEHNWGNSID
jgi:hypothetical protein